MERKFSNILFENERIGLTDWEFNTVSIVNTAMETSKNIIPQIIMGLDQSYTSTGIVIMRSDGEVNHAEVFRTDKGVDTFQRAWNVAQHVKNVCIEHKVGHVAIEGLAFGMTGNATRDLAGLQFTIVNVLRSEMPDVTIDVISPLSIKKLATGNARKVSKKDMLEALPANVYDLLTETLKIKKTKGLYDTTDAYWLARYSYEEFNNGRS